ncbi:MAG TPA: hypothetical protein P5280_03590 [Cyclobacteriaceae bacterium]|nr:hypothetical protein [Cyclobacteriaceae bacterium]
MLVRLVDSVRENQREWARLIILFKKHFAISLTEINAMDFRKFYQFLKEIEDIKRAESEVK